MLLGDVALETDVLGDLLEIPGAREGDALHHHVDGVADRYRWPVARTISVAPNVATSAASGPSARSRLDAVSISRSAAAPVLRSWSRAFQPFRTLARPPRRSRCLTDSRSGSPATAGARDLGPASRTVTSVVVVRGSAVDELAEQMLGVLAGRSRTGSSRWSRARVAAT